MDAKTREPRRDTRSLLERKAIPVDRMSMPLRDKNAFKKASRKGDRCTAADVYAFAYGHRRSTSLTQENKRRGIQALRFLRIRDFGADLTKAIVDDAVAAGVAAAIETKQEEWQQERRDLEVDLSLALKDLEAAHQEIIELHRRETILRKQVKRRTTCSAALRSSATVHQMTTHLIDRHADSDDRAPVLLEFGGTLRFRHVIIGATPREATFVISGRDAAQMLRRFRAHDKRHHSYFGIVKMGDPTNPVAHAALFRLAFRLWKGGPDFPAVSGAVVFSGVDDAAIERMLAPKVASRSARVPGHRLEIKVGAETFSQHGIGDSLKDLLSVILVAATAGNDPAAGNGSGHARVELGADTGEL